MEVKTVVKETWLSRPAKKHALDFSLALLGLLFLGSAIFLSSTLGADLWMPANGEFVFHSHQYWRAWTTLFAHGDLGHLLGNSLLFFPFSFFLIGYFGPVFFPLLGIFIGGIVNLIVLSTMPHDAYLIGFSGVVYWMGAAWLTFYLLIERREKWARRCGKVIFVTAALFVPETFRPEVSYLSHFLGFLLGGISALAYFRLFRAEFRDAEKAELIIIEDIVEEEEWKQDAI